MLNQAKINITYYVSWLVKILVVFGLTYLVYEKLWLGNKNTEILDLIKNAISNGNLSLLLLCVMLSPFNWLLEALKWQKLTNEFQTIGWKERSESILVGITFGILTPSRLGEYGGRLLHIHPSNRSKAIYAYFLSSISQNIPIVLLGCISLATFLTNYYQVDGIISISITSLLFLLSILLVLILFQNDFIWNQFSKIKYIKNLMGNVTIHNYTSSLISTILTMSTLRYIIYMSQYVLLLYFFKVDVTLSESIVGVGVIFLLQSGLALPPALSVITRAELAILIWSNFDNANEYVLLSVPILLWTINLLIPALVGGCIILKSNLQKQFFIK